jgi:hypothetical protein
MSKLIYCPTCNAKIVDTLFNTTNYGGWPSWHPLYCSRWGDMDNPREWPRAVDLDVKYEPIVEHPEQDQLEIAEELAGHKLVEGFVKKTSKIGG